MPSKEISIGEFLKTVRAKSIINATLAIGYYLEIHRGISPFSIADLEVAFREARMPLPKNLNQTVNNNIRKGFVMDANVKKNGRKAWALTNTGIEYIEGIILPPAIPKSEKEDKVSTTTKVDVPNLSFVSDAKIRYILERDWLELTRGLDGGNWKSAIILSGGILEAVLLDSLLKDPINARNTKMKLKNSGVLVSERGQIDEWNFFTLIEVATEMGLITKLGQHFGSATALRDYRNLVHPHKEVKGGYKIRKPDATAIFWALQGLVLDLQEHFGVTP